MHSEDVEDSSVDGSISNSIDDDVSDDMSQNSNAVRDKSILRLKINDDL